MGVMYGDKPLPVVALKGSAVLVNGMYAVWGKLYMDNEGRTLVDADVYSDRSMKTLVSMQRGITIFGQPEDNADEVIVMLLNSMSYEF